jgi:hemoglobin
MTEASEVTLFDRIGGAQAVEAMVFAFYRRVLSDAELSPFFVDVSIEKLHVMQKEFFSAALDGPIGYRGRSLSEIHAGLGIQPRHVRRFLEHLIETMKGMDLDETDRYEVYSRIATRVDELTGQVSVDG